MYEADDVRTEAKVALKVRKCLLEQPPGAAMPARSSAQPASGSAHQHTVVRVSW